MLKETVGHLNVHLFVLLGAPGSGKGFCGKHLEVVCEGYGVCRREMSAIIKKYKTHPELQDEFREADELIKSGKLVPDTPVMKALGKEIAELAESGFSKIILDGFPRTVNQAQALIESGVAVTPFAIDSTPDECIANLEKGKRKGDRGQRADDDHKIFLGRIEKYFSGEGEAVIQCFEAAGNHVVHVNGSYRPSTKLARMIENMGFNGEARFIMSRLSDLNIDDDDVIPQRAAVLA